MANIFKTRLIIISAIICLTAIILTLGSSNWWTSVAFNCGVHNLDFLNNLEAILATLAASSFICFFVGICLWIYFIVSLIWSFIKKGKGFARVMMRGAVAVILIFVPIKICSAHVLDNMFRPHELPYYDNKLSVAKLSGKYYHGDGLGFNLNLDITPDSTYACRWQGCCGIYEASDGTATIVNGYLSLIPNSVMKEKTGSWGSKMEFYKPAHPTTITLIPIQWGERIYLIEPTEMINFCIAINHGQEPRHKAHGYYYLRDGDWTKNVSERISGLPNLPAPWNSLQFNRLSQ